MRLPVIAVLVALCGCQDILGLEISAPPSTGQLGCDPATQSGCDDGDKCAFVVDDPSTGTGRFDCVVDGAAAIGQPCAEPTASGQADDCQAGLHCVLGSCAALCIGPGSCSAGSCMPVVEKLDVGLQLDVCLEPCNPFAPDCTDGACYFDRRQGPICLRPGSLSPDAPCSRAADCGPGLGCHEDSFGERRCKRYCDSLACTDQTGAPNACGCGNCASDEVCTDFFEIDLAGVGAGVCTTAEELSCACDTPPVCEF